MVKSLLSAWRKAPGRSAVAMSRSLCALMAAVMKSESVLTVGDVISSLA